MGTICQTQTSTNTQNPFRNYAGGSPPCWLIAPLLSLHGTLLPKQLLPIDSSTFKHALAPLHLDCSSVALQAGKENTHKFCMGFWRDAPIRDGEIDSKRHALEISAPCPSHNKGEYFSWPHRKLKVLWCNCEINARVASELWNMVYPVPILKPKGPTSKLHIAQKVLSSQKNDATKFLFCSITQSTILKEQICERRRMSLSPWNLHSKWQLLCLCVHGSQSPPGHWLIKLGSVPFGKDDLWHFLLRVKHSILQEAS